MSHCGDADCHASSPQSPPCPAPAKGQSRATLPYGSSPRKGCPFAGPHALVRNDMLKTVTRLRLQGRGARKVRGTQERVSGCKDVSPLSLRGAERRGNPHPLRQYMAESSTLGEYAATTNLPEVVPSCQVSLRGKRIAAPVCALVRNDMQKEGRVRGCKDVSPLSLRGAKRRDNPRTRRAA